MIDVLAAEWIKIRTVRATYVVLGVVAGAVGLAALLMWYVTVVWDRMSAPERGHVYASDMTDVTTWAAQLAFAVLGVLTVSSEYATGLIRTTLTAVPARRTVLWAKAAVTAGSALVVAQLALFLTFEVCRLIVGDRRISGQPTGPLSRHAPLLLATGLEITVFALLGLGLAAITRSTVASIAILVVLWYPLPIVVGNLSQPWHGRIGSCLMGGLARQIAGIRDEHTVFGTLLPPAAALAVLAGYAVVPLAVATVLMRRRDVR